MTGVPLLASFLLLGAYFTYRAEEVSAASAGRSMCRASIRLAWVMFFLAILLAVGQVWIVDT